MQPKAGLGWGEHFAANEKLEQIAPEWRAHPSGLQLHCHIYAKAKRWDLAVASKAMNFAMNLSLGIGILMFVMQVSA